MNVDGSGQRRLTSGGDWEFGPQWSPDGHRLAYMVWDDSACTRSRGPDAPSPTSGPSTRTGPGIERSSTAHSSRGGRPTVRSLLPAARRESRSRHAGRLRRKQRRHPRETARSSEPLGVPTSPSGVVADWADDPLRSRDGRCPPPPSQPRRPQKAVPRRRRIAGVVARRQPDRLHAQQRHLVILYAPGRIAAASTRHTIPFPAWSPAGKQLAYNSGKPAVRRPHRRALDETRRAGRHPYVRAVAKSHHRSGLATASACTTGLRSPSGAFLNGSVGRAAAFDPRLS